MFNEIINFIKSQFPNQDFIPLHEPQFSGNEKKYLNDCIDSTYVSSVGAYVDKFEDMMVELTGSKYAVATVNGTNALHIALIVLGVKQDDEVLTQALSFVATSNAISYIGASPVFIDVDKSTLGMSSQALHSFLTQNAEVREDGFTYNKLTSKKIAACIPMHTFGLPCKIDEIAEVCRTWNIKLIEDAAESLGSYYQNKHTGTFGEIGVFSFNGNKTITSGGGGVLITNNEAIFKKTKHLTTQAKTSHAWAFLHDQIGYNYRMPNLNAALACAQLELLEKYVTNKRELADIYRNYFNNSSVTYVEEPENSKSNYWLNVILLNNLEERNEFLEVSNNNGIMTRPAWELMINLPMFKDCLNDGLKNSRWLSDRIVNIPSSVRKI